MPALQSTEVTYKEPGWLAQGMYMSGGAAMSVLLVWGLESFVIPTDILVPDYVKLAFVSILGSIVGKFGT